MEYENNKYSMWYFSLVNSRKYKNNTSVYLEKHHIIPKSLGGSDTEENLVFLTAREHYIAHILLVKMLKGKSKKSMSYALWMMTNASTKHQKRYAPNSKLYEFARKNFVSSLKGHKPTIIKQPEEAKQKLSEIMKAKMAELTPEEMRERLLKSFHNPNSWTDERRKKISESTKGTPKTKTKKFYLAKEKTREERTLRMLECAKKNKGKTWRLIDGKRVWMEKSE
jgi:hypothetical protein